MRVAQDVWSHLSENIKGDAMSVTDANMAEKTDWAKVRKYYKLNGLPWLDALPVERKLHESEMIILASMAVRGV